MCLATEAKKKKKCCHVCLQQTEMLCCLLTALPMAHSLHANYMCWSLSGKHLSCKRSDHNSDRFSLWLIVYSVSSQSS